MISSKSKRIRVINSPKVVEQTVFFILRGLLLALIVVAGLILDSMKGAVNDLILLPVFILAIVLLIMFTFRLRTILLPKQYMYGNENSLSVQLNKKEILKHSWEHVSEVFIFHEGIKVYLLLILNSKEEIKYELCKNWLFTELNLKGIARTHYIDLMNMFSQNISFLEKLNRESEEEFKKEFDL